MPVTRQLTADVDQLLQRAHGLVRPGRRTLLGITGAPGAGKSTLMAALLAGLGESGAAVPMDGFHLSNEVLQQLGRRDRKGAWDTFDIGGYVSLLQRVRACEEEVIYAPAFDRSRETATAAAIAVPRGAPLVITEGNYLLHDEGGWERVRPLLDEVWFLQVPAAERVHRLIGRRVGDGEDRQQAAAWVQGVDETNAEVVLTSATRADLVVTLTSTA